MPGQLRALRASLHHAYAITTEGDVFRWGWLGAVEPWRPELLLRDDAAVARAVVRVTCPLVGATAHVDLRASATTTVVGYATSAAALAPHVR